jgi:hypothetical protein
MMAITETMKPAEGFIMEHREEPMPSIWTDAEGELFGKVMDKIIAEGTFKMESSQVPMPEQLGAT